MANNTTKHPLNDHDEYSRLCLAHSSGISGGRHGNPPDNASTDGVVVYISGNRISCHGYLNAFFATVQQTPNTLILTSLELSVKSAFITTEQ